MCCAEEGYGRMDGERKRKDAIYFGGSWERAAEEETGEESFLFLEWSFKSVGIVRVESVVGR